jgi:hypothetical protein
MDEKRVDSNSSSKPLNYWVRLLKKIMNKSNFIKFAANLPGSLVLVGIKRFG